MSPTRKRADAGGEEHQERQEGCGYLFPGSASPETSVNQPYDATITFYDMSDSPKKTTLVLKGLTEDLAINEKHRADAK